MADERLDAAAEEAIEDMFGHAATDLVFGDGGAIDEGAAVGAMADHAAGFHLSEHGGDGGVGEVGATGDGFLDGGDGGFLSGPERLHDLELEITEAMKFGLAHGVSMTGVILLR